MLDAINMVLLSTSQTLQTKLIIDGIIKLTACCYIFSFHSGERLYAAIQFGRGPWKLVEAGVDDSPECLKLRYYLAKVIKCYKMFLPLVFLLDTINFMVHVSAFQRVLRFDGLKKLQSRTHKSLQWYFCNYFYKTLTGRCRWYFLEGLIVKHWSDFIPGNQRSYPGLLQPALVCFYTLQ